MNRFAAMLVMVAALAAERPAHADDTKAAVRLAVDGAVARTRRKIAFGPMIGVGGAFTPGSNELDLPISFGIGLYLFKIPILPTPADLQQIILQKMKQRVADTIEDMAARGEPPPTAEEAASIAEEVLVQLRDEYLGRRHRDRTLEKPQLAIAIEEVRLPSAGAWMTRLTAGFGISKVTIGPSITGSLGDVRGLYLGGELAVHLTPRAGPRSPVIDVFFRADWGVTGGAREADLYALGARVMLDLI